MPTVVRALARPGSVLRTSVTTGGTSLMAAIAVVLPAPGGPVKTILLSIAEPSAQTQALPQATHQAQQRRRLRRHVPTLRRTARGARAADHPQRHRGARRARLGRQRPRRLDPQDALG